MVTFVMMPKEIDLLMETARQILADSGVYMTTWPAGKEMVKSWVLTKAAAGHRRSARQAALYYLGLVTAEILK
jgi:hypothetical protein